MDINLQNLIFIFGHIIEVITFMSLAFASQVGWFVGDSATSEVSDAALA